MCILIKDKPHMQQQHMHSVVVCRMCICICSFYKAYDRRYAHEMSSVFDEMKPHHLQAHTRILSVMMNTHTYVQMKWMLYIYIYGIHMRVSCLSFFLWEDTIYMYIMIWVCVSTSSSQENFIYWQLLYKLMCVCDTITSNSEYTKTRWSIWNLLHVYTIKKYIYLCIYVLYSTFFVFTFRIKIKKKKI